MSAQKQLFKTITALFFGMIGSGVLQFGIALYILRETGSSLSFSMTIIISPIVSILLTPLIGHVVDRFDRKTIISLGQIASVAVLVIFAALFYRVTPILALVLPVLIILKIVDLFFSAAYLSAMRGIVLDEQIPRLQSFMSGFQSIAGILSPMLGALLYAWLTMPVYILIVTACELLAWLINLTIDYRFNPAIATAEPTAAPDKVWASFRQGFAYVRTRPDLIRMSAVAMIVNFLLMVKLVGIPILLVQTYQLSDTEYGFVQMSASIGLLVMSLIYGVLNYQPKRPLLILYLLGIPVGLATMTMGLPALLGFSKTIAIPYFFINMLIGGAVAATVNIPMGIYMQQEVEDAYKGRVFMLFSTLATALTPISILLFGWLFDFLPVSPVLIAVGGLLITLISLIWYFTPRQYLTAKETPYDVLSQSQ